MKLRGFANVVPSPNSFWGSRLEKVQRQWAGHIWGWPAAPWPQPAPLRPRPLPHLPTGPLPAWQCGLPPGEGSGGKEFSLPSPPPTGVCSCSEGSIRLQAASSGLAQGGASLLEPRISLCQAKARLPLVAQRSALLLLPAPRRAAPAPLLSPRHSRQLPEPHQPLRTAQPRLRPVLCRPPRARDRCRAWDTAEGTQSGPNSLETPTSRLPPPPSWSVTGVRIVGNHSLIG